MQYNPNIHPSNFLSLPTVTRIKKQILVQIKNLRSKSSKVINLTENSKQQKMAIFALPDRPGSLIYSAKVIVYVGCRYDYQPNLYIILFQVT